MLVLAVLVAGLSTAQIDHTYQATNAVYASNKNYVLCATCPESTPKTPIPPAPKEEAKPAPVRIQFAELLAKKKASAPLPLPQIKETVYFDLGSAKLKDSEKLKIDRIDKGRKYSVTGYTCDLGNAKVNDRLALKRADSVAKYLGNAASEITGKGNCCYADTDNRKANRRVEIISVTKGGENE